MRSTHNTIAELLAKNDYKGTHELEEAYIGKQEESGRYSKHAAITPNMQDEHDKQIAELLARKDYKGAQ